MDVYKKHPRGAPCNQKIRQMRRENQYKAKARHGPLAIISASLCWFVFACDGWITEEETVWICDPWDGYLNQSQREFSLTLDCHISTIHP